MQVIEEVSDVTDLESSGITHLIAPPRSRNMKKLAAQATQRFVLSEQWVADSAEQVSAHTPFNVI